MDRINNWDLVDLGAPYVVGGYLFDKPRDVLYELARSDERLGAPHGDRQPRLYFIRQGKVDDTFAIAEILLDDEHDLIHKATGGLAARGGQKDRPRLLALPRRARRHHAAHHAALRHRAPRRQAEGALYAARRR